MYVEPPLRVQLAHWVSKKARRWLATHKQRTWDNLALVDDLIKAPSRSQALLEAYGLFGRLPPELRQRILKYAFKVGRIHIDLSYDHPHTFFEPVYQETFALEYIPIKQLAVGYRHANISGVDTSKPKIWRWSASVCHRVSELAPQRDFCVSGHAKCEQVHLYDRNRSSCFIGIDGFMKACWMSYIEASETLFAENELQLASKVFVKPLRNLPNLINTMHLHNIHSLSLVTAPDFHDVFFESLATNRELLLSIPDVFPNLKRLLVTFAESISFSAMESEGKRLTMENVFLMSCDELALRLPKTEIEIQFDWTLVSLLRRKYSEEERRMEPIGESQQRFWRKIDRKDSSDRRTSEGYFMSSLQR